MCCPSNLGKETVFFLFFGGFVDAAECSAVTVSIEKPTLELDLDLEGLRAKVNALENDEDLEKEIQQLQVSLVMLNQANSSHLDEGDRAVSLNRIFQHSKEVTFELSRVC